MGKKHLLSQLLGEQIRGEVKQVSDMSDVSNAWKLLGEIYYHADSICNLQPPLEKQGWLMLCLSFISFVRGVLCSLYVAV